MLLYILSYMYIPPGRIYVYMFILYIFIYRINIYVCICLSYMSVLYLYAYPICIVPIILLSYMYSPYYPIILYVQSLLSYYPICIVPISYYPSHSPRAAAPGPRRSSPLARRGRRRREEN